MSKKPINGKIFKVANNYVISKEKNVMNLNKYDMTVKDNPQYVTEYIYDILGELRQNEVNLYNLGHKPAF